MCADPNNLPFSSRDGSGFENKLAELLARNMGVRLRYVWWAQRRGFVRNTLTEAKCELWPGVASRLERVLTTDPGMGVIRHADAGYQTAIDFAREHGIDRAM